VSIMHACRESMSDNTQGPATESQGSGKPSKQILSSRPRGQDHPIDRGDSHQYNRSVCVLVASCRPNTGIGIKTIHYIGH
jgi:hypothetical protein